MLDTKRTFELEDYFARPEIQQKIESISKKYELEKQGFDLGLLVDFIRFGEV